MSARPVTAPRIHSLLAGLLACWGSSTGTQAQCQYEVTAVIAAPRCPPPFNNVPATIGTALTEGPDPAVVGFYFPCGAGTADTAFVWRASTGLISLPRPPGVTSMQAADISESGVIVGTYDSAERGFRGFIYENGQYTELAPLPGGAWSGTCAIAEDGTVVGFRSIGSKGDPVNPFNAFIWSESDGFDDLGVMSGPNSAATAINVGSIVGWTGGNFLDSTAFVVHQGVIVSLGAIPGGTTSFPTGVSRTGAVCGWGLVPEKGFPFGVNRAFLWEDGQYTHLGTLPKHLRSVANDISPVDQVVGSSWTVGGSSAIRHAFIWQDGFMHNLNDLSISGPAIVLQSANAVNDAGQIAADGYDASFNRVTFVLTPVGKPVGDIDIDCHVGVADLVILLDDWAQNNSPADLNNDGVVNVLDLIILLLNFGS